MSNNNRSANTGVWADTREAIALEKNDPFAFQQYKGESITHPQYFDCWDNDKAYKEPVPMEIKLWMNYPDALSNMKTYMRFSATEMLVLDALHKNTLGFLNETKTSQYASDRTIRFKEMPYNMISYSFGNYNRKSTGQSADGKMYLKKSANNTRARMMRTTVRLYAKAIKRPRTCVHRAFKSLEYRKVIQLQSHPVLGTILGINYLTIESIFGGNTVAYQPSATKKKPAKGVGNNTKAASYVAPQSDLERMVAEDLVEVKGRYVTRIKSSIENIVKLQHENRDVKAPSNKSYADSHAPFRLMMSRAFPNNVFVRKAFFPVLYQQPAPA